MPLCLISSSSWSGYELFEHPHCLAFPFLLLHFPFFSFLSYISLSILFRFLSFALHLSLHLIPLYLFLSLPFPPLFVFLPFLSIIFDFQYILLFFKSLLISLLVHSPFISSFHLLSSSSPSSFFLSFLMFRSFLVPLFHISFLYARFPFVFCCLYVSLSWCSSSPSS